tara:strand:+ start:315 stop:488 length:174 start_codon:yes stop_codon:yes gene_type:complete
MVELVVNPLVILELVVVELQQLVKTHLQMEVVKVVQEEQVQLMLLQLQDQVVVEVVV